MIYFGNPSSDLIRVVMSLPNSPLGCITTPKQGNKVPKGALFCADNGCFGKGYPGDEEWLAWLAKKAGEECVFATAPDVVGDAAATLERSAPWLPRIRELGVPAALVAQDGLEFESIPWDSFDVLFLGGSTEWKVSIFARDLADQALARGKWVHMGRVNSLKRTKLAAEWGCHSIDGTFLAFGPDVNLPIVLDWMDHVNGTGWAERLARFVCDTESQGIESQEAA